MRGGRIPSRICLFVTTSGNNGDEPGWCVVDGNGYFHKGSSDLVKVTFKETGKGRTAFQRAISYNANNAVSGIRTDIKIHYDRVAVGSH